MKAGIYLYPWDLEDEGAESVIARLRDTGLDAISLAVSYHAGKFTRPHANGQKVYFPEDGTIYFPPDLSHYGRVKPIVNSRVGGYEALQVLERAAPGFSVTAWTVGLHNSPLGRAHPDLVVRNAYGDPLWNSLCPSKPDVRAYLVALCADIANNQPVAEVAIETPGWQAFRHGHHHEFELIDLTQNAQILLGTCFCDDCVAAAGTAGIDAAALKARTRGDLGRFFADGAEPTDPATDDAWQPFVAWRATTVTSLVAEIRDEMPPHVGLAIVPSTQSPNSLSWIEGSDLLQLAGIARLEVPAYQRGLGPIAADVGAVRATAGADARIGYILRPTPNLPSPAALRDAVAMIAADGATGVSFYNYGHMRLSTLGWIKEALA